MLDSPSQLTSLTQLSQPGRGVCPTAGSPRTTVSQFSRHAGPTAPRPPVPEPGAGGPPVGATVHPARPAAADAEALGGIAARDHGSNNRHLTQLTANGGSLANQASTCSPASTVGGIDNGNAAATATDVGVATLAEQLVEFINENCDVFLESTKEKFGDGNLGFQLCTGSLSARPRPSAG